MQQVELQVKGMSCGNCVRHIEEALKQLGAEGTADLSAQTVRVQYDESRIALSAIRQAIEEEGYEVV